MAVKLTKTQANLTREIESVVARLDLNFRDIRHVDSSLRTAHLDTIKKQLIKGAVLGEYLLMDEFLNVAICGYFFGRKRRFPNLSRTKRFRAFNFFILERLYLVQKLDLVKFAYKVPRPVSKDLYALNDLRNAIAHSFFPENRRRKPEWKNKDIFSLDGLVHFLNDMERAGDFFVQRIWHVRTELIAENWRGA
jgi:hypothetical protein